MNTKWNVRLGDIALSVSKDLCLHLKFEAPYSNDETNTARFDIYNDNPIPYIAEAVAAGYRDDEAAIQALALKTSRRAQQMANTARQKIAEIEAKAATDRRAAEGMALARDRESAARSGGGRA